MKKSKEKFQKYLKINEAENINDKSLWYAAEIVLKRKFIATQVHFRRQESIKDQQKDRIKGQQN